MEFELDMEWGQGLAQEGETEICKDLQKTEPAGCAWEVQINSSQEIQTSVSKNRPVEASGKDLEKEKSGLTRRNKVWEINRCMKKKSGKMTIGYKFSYAYSYPLKVKDACSLKENLWQTLTAY